MKRWLQQVYSFIKRVFFFLKLHIHVEAGIRSDTDEENNQ